MSPMENVPEGSCGISNSLARVESLHTRDFVQAGDEQLEYSAHPLDACHNPSGHESGANIDGF